MKHFTLLAIVIAIVALSGCAPKPNYYDSISYGDELDAKNSTEIGRDIAEFLEPFYAPAQTVFIITPYGNETNFLSGIENTLRLKGYAVTREINRTNAKPFAYKAQYIDVTEGILRVTLNIETAHINRLYQYNFNKNIFVAISPFTAQGLPSPVIIPDIKPPTKKPKATPKKTK